MSENKKILICEDEKTTLMLLQRVLEKMGYEVLIDSTGDASFDYIQNEDLSMIITDLNMPSVNGFEIIEYARKKCQRTYPIAVLSNMHFQETEAQARELGADVFIGKPFDLKTFSDTIGNLLVKD